MENTLNEEKNKIWLNYRSFYGHEEFSLEHYVNVAREIKPELTYLDCCSLVLEQMRKRNDVIVPFVPKVFVSVCRELIKTIEPSKVLVNYADGSEAAVFDDISIADFYFVNEEYKKLAIKYLHVNCIDEPKVKYGFIIEDLMLGQTIYNDITLRMVEETMELLNSEGYAVFTALYNITSNRAKRWLNELKAKGIYLNAVLDMPLDAYEFSTSLESTNICIFSKNKTDKLFLASLSDESAISNIVSNFINHSESKSNSKLGVYVEDDVITYADYYDKCKINKLNQTLSKAYNGTSIKISEFGEVHAPDRNNKFIENKLSIYIPKLGNSPVVANEEDFRIKAQNYFQVIFDEEKILQRYLLMFLNSEEGLKLRQLYSKGVTIKALNTKIIGEIKVPCPSIEVQAQYLSTYDQIERLSSEVETLKAKFQKTPASYKNIRKDIKDVNNHGDKFIQWIESLPYPIATILKRYSVSDDLTKKQETLFYFFEAYSIFESTILSAALNKKIIDCSSLKSVDSSFFEKASFGNWVRMDRALSNLFNDKFNSKDKNEMAKKAVLSCFRTEDDNLIRLLCNKKVCNILDDACEKRNLWKGHGGITNDTIYKEHVEALDNLLRKLQESIKDLYDKIRLIRPLELAYANGQFDNKVEVLTGSNSIFTKDNIMSLSPLDNTKLYIQLIDTGETLELPPYFILKNSPADVKNACYFYNRVDGGKTRYVSYHYDGKPEDTENGETALDIIKDILAN